MLDRHSLTVLVADDDADDRLLIEDAFIECGLKNKRQYVEDGVELLEYLRGQGKWEGRNPNDLPGLILLDLNMPRMDGRTALSQLKEDPALRRIPVIVLTTSKAQEDIFGTYKAGVSSFITKPVTFDDLVEIVESINHFWLELSHLPAELQPA